MVLWRRVHAKMFDAMPPDTSINHILDITIGVREQEQVHVIATHVASALFQSAHTRRTYGLCTVIALSDHALSEG
jgi:hypothetical protein